MMHRISVGPGCNMRKMLSQQLLWRRPRRDLSAAFAAAAAAAAGLGACAVLAPAAPSSCESPLRQSYMRQYRVAASGTTGRLAGKVALVTGAGSGIGQAHQPRAVKSSSALASPLNVLKSEYAYDHSCY